MFDVSDCENVKISGYTVDGTFQQYLVRKHIIHATHCLILTRRKVSWVNSVTPIPDGIESEAAASILCAVCTASIHVRHPSQWSDRISRV